MKNSQFLIFSAKNKEISICIEEKDAISPFSSRIRLILRRYSSCLSM